MALSYGSGQVGNADTEYWAGFESKELIARLQRKREEFLEFFDRSNYFQRIYRNWAYYHGINFRRGSSNNEIRIGGDEGELRLAQVNEFKTNIDLLATYVIEGDIEWDALATGDGADALNATRKVNKLLDGIAQSRDYRLDGLRRQAVKDALVLTAGYGWVLWDKNHGEPAGVDASGKTIRWKGDMRIVNPSLFDVVFDFTRRDFAESQWVEARRQENVWDLAEEFPQKKKREAILATRNDVIDRKYRKFDFSLPSEEAVSRDHRWVHYFYHKPCPALPTGRFMRRVGQVELEDEMRLPDKHIPISRLIPGQFILTPFGFTDAFSAQASQEALNMTQSMIITNQNALGPTKVWKKKGEPINRAQLEPGIVLIETETEPKKINLLDTPKELYDSLQIYGNQVQRALHVNDTAHGDPDPSIKAAAAMAFAEQRVTQAASEFVDNARDFARDLGTSIVKVHAARMDPEDKRTIDVRTSDMDRAQRVTFTAEELQQIKNVSVIAGNPAMRTRAGRIQVAEVLLEKEAIQSDEFVTVIKTGKLDKLMEAEDNQLQLVHEENEDILQGRGGEHVAQPDHNHMLHIRRHLAQADSEASRRFPELGNSYRAAALEHKQFLTFVDETPVLLMDELGQPVIDPMSGQPAIDEAATMENKNKAQMVQQAIEYNKLLGYLPPTFIPFGAPPPPPEMGGAPPGAAPAEALETTPMGTPPTAVPPAPAPPAGAPQNGGSPRLVGVGGAAADNINAGM